MLDMKLPRHWLAALGLFPFTLGVVGDAKADFTEPEASPALRWGPYRPNLYFGVRPQIPNTLLMGLMWSSGENREAMMKSTCFIPFHPELRP